MLGQRRQPPSDKMAAALPKLWTLATGGTAVASQQLVDGDRKPQSARSGRTVAEQLKRLIDALIGDAAVRIEFWDGSALGPDDGVPTLAVRSPETIRRLAWAPDELGLGRAYVAGEIDTDGDLYELLRRLRPAGVDLRAGLKTVPAALGAARRLRVLGAPPAPPPEEANPKGRRHSKSRDADAISHHYDVGNDFYRLVLGPAMTYSCAFFPERDMSLADAQAVKHERICRKLGLHERPGVRLLDIGCGWGSMAMHAATRHGAAGGRHNDQPRASRARPRACQGCGARRSCRDPSPGLPRPRRRAVRRGVFDRHVRARRRHPHGGVLHDRAIAAERPRPPAQPCDLRRRRLQTRQAQLRRPLRLSRRRVDRRRRSRARDGGGRVRGARRRVAP